MKSPALDEDRLQSASIPEIHSALFGQLVAGHAQMALVLLGRMPHPETGQPASPAVEDAKVFIDQLEMLEAKTHGNLNAGELRLLKEVLGVTRQALVEVLDAGLKAEDGVPTFPPAAADVPASPLKPAAP